MSTTEALLGAGSIVAVCPARSHSSPVEAAKVEGVTGLRHPVVVRARERP